jgi:small subunit ribosomal protein S2
MIDIQIEDMMNAGAHFGHQTKRWNPKMRPYLYGSRSGVHIIDLQKTKSLAVEALEFVTKQVASGKNVLLVGTKPQAREIIQREATRASMFYVTDRWMGGTLTNFQTIKKSIDRLIDLETRRENNDLEGYTKKEKLDIDRTIEKLLASLGGIKGMKGAPGIIFVVDPKQEHIAILEAKKLGIPVVAITDSNCNPDPIDYIIPGNDDALSSIEYFTIKLADACLAGLDKREANTTQVYDEQRQGDKGKGRRGPRTRSVKGGDAPNSYVSKTVQAQTFEGDAAGGFSAKTEVAETPAAPVAESKGE